MIRRGGEATISAPEEACGAERDGGCEQRRAAVPRGAGGEALRRALRQHRPAGALLLRVRPRRARRRPRPAGAPRHARGLPEPRQRQRCRGGLPRRGIPQRLPRRRFQHPG